MKCEIEFCLYNKEGGCELPEITVNGYDMCDDCEMLDFPRELLDKMKVYQQNHK